MNRNPHEIRAEAEAIRRLLEVAKGAREIRSHVQFLAAKVESGARRLDDDANVIESREVRRRG